MLSVILTILKVIGIILLVLIAILVLLTALVLLVPLRYGVSSVRKQELGKLPQVNACITWLLKLAGVYVDFSDGKLEIRVQILRFCLKKIERQLIKGKKAEKPEKDEKDTILEEPETADIEKSGTGQTEQAEIPETLKEPEKHELIPETVKETEREEVAETAEKPEEKEKVSETIPETPARNEDTATKRKKRKEKKDHPAQDETAKPKQSGIGKLTHLITKIPEFIADVIVFIFDLPNEADDAADRIREKLEPLRKKADKFLDARSRSVYRKALRKLLKLLRHYRIRRIDGYLHAGTGKPDLTGKLTGLIYLLIPDAKGDFTVNPEFTEKVFEADIRLKGHIRLNHAVHFAVSLLLDKEFRLFLRRVRGKEKKEKQRKAVTQDG